MKVRKGDTVLLIGGKDRGKQGKVLRVLPKEGRLLVEGLNMVKHHMKARRPALQGGILEREALLPVSRVMLLCNRCHHPARVGFRLLEDGRKVRLCRSCGEVMD